MAAESEDPEVKLAWHLYDRIERLIDLQSPSPEGLPAQATEIDGYILSYTIAGICSVVDLKDRTDLQRATVFGAYIDGGALLYDMPAAGFCRDVLLPLLDRELVLDDLAAV